MPLISIPGRAALPRLSLGMVCVLAVGLCSCARSTPTPVAITIAFAFPEVDAEYYEPLGRRFASIHSRQQPRRRVARDVAGRESLGELSKFLPRSLFVLMMPSQPRATHTCVIAFERVRVVPQESGQPLVQRLLRSVCQVPGVIRAHVRAMMNRRLRLPVHGAAWRVAVAAGPHGTHTHVLGKRETTLPALSSVLTSRR